MSTAVVISVLARSLLAGEPSANAAYARAARTLGRPWRWLRPLGRRYVEAFAGSPRPRHRDVIRFLLADQGFAGALAKYRHQILIAEWLAEPQRMLPVEAAAQWNLPRIENLGDLAAWLSVSPAELEWFA